MSVDVTGIGTAVTGVKDILGMFFPDKTEEEKTKIAAALQVFQAQTNINQAEAQSTDPLQHWRGGMGWVCVLGYFHNFIFQPLFTDVVAILGKHATLAPLDIGPLATLTAGMLGLGGLHVVQQINGK
jgi:Holin of 3TMs, for gene-transfer release